MAPGWLVALPVIAMALSACGGSGNLTCEEVRGYRGAALGKRVVAPEDLDDLEPLREMPLPEASPRSPRPPGAPCIDRPPAVQIGS